MESFNNCDIQAVKAAAYLSKQPSPSTVFLVMIVIFKWKIWINVLQARQLNFQMGKITRKSLINKIQCANNNGTLNILLSECTIVKFRRKNHFVLLAGLWLGFTQRENKKKLEWAWSFAFLRLFFVAKPIGAIKQENREH